MVEWAGTGWNGGCVTLLPTEPSLTLYVVVVVVVKAVVVGQLPPHHELLDEGGDGRAESLPTALHLQGGALGRQVAWGGEEIEVDKEKETKKERRWRQMSAYNKKDRGWGGEDIKKDLKKEKYIERGDVL